MRGHVPSQPNFISLINVETLIAPDHPLRVIKRMLDAVLRGMSEHFDEIYAAADYISIHTNLTPETHALLGAKSFPRMKKGVLILNCARGEVVNTAEMVAALESGQVGGYGTDVLDEEPPAADHPLLRLPNVVVTPHIASRTYESVVRQATTSVKNLILAMNGEKPIAQVNPEVPVRKVV